MNIQDVAKLAGVSASTVSKVMNGKDKDISEDTRKKIHKIVAETNYVPYLKFREKENLRSRLLGLILRKDHREKERLVLSAEKEASHQGYHLLVHYISEPGEIPLCLQALIDRKVAGALLDSDVRIPLGDLKDRTVFLSQSEKCAIGQKGVFYYSMIEAGYLAAERLMQSGHQKIACITDTTGHDILKGYRQAMRDANLPIKASWTYEGHTLEDIEKLGVRQCIESTTAVICSSKEIACCFWNMTQKNCIAIPETLSVIVIGDDPLLEILNGGMTAVRFPVEELCTEAVACLIDRIHDEKPVTDVKQFSMSLVERKSILPPIQDRQGGKIVVVGSMNLDITIEVSRIPVDGETQIAQRVYQFPGGKGGNQAVGIGKLGGQAYMIGCLGNDIDGRHLYNELLENHVHVDGVTFDSSISTGKAYINVDQNGESAIVVYTGANQKLDVSHISWFRHLFSNARYCLLSLEIAPEVVEYTVQYCKRNKTEVILKPSNVTSIKEELLGDIAYFVPNEKELHLLVPGIQTLEEKAEFLLKKGIKNVIVTLGSKGCYLKNQEYSMYFPGTDFDAVDTTGGADSFISALAVYLSEGKSLLTSIGFSIYASGITVTKYGVQSALPDRQAVDIYADEIYAKYDLLEKGDHL